MAKKSTSSSKSQYSDNALRERLKKKIMASTKGGNAGQWSARKAQLLAAEYKKAGGTYTGKRKAPQKHLKEWTEEKWQTKSGSARARHGKATDRYLPKKAWDKLSPAEKKATNAKKRKGSKAGTQFVANTKAAKTARGKASKKSKK